MQKRVLLITYHYPPILSAGVSRLVGLTKYLSRAGWHCTVVTVARSYTEGSDEASLGRIPRGVSVVRTCTCEVDRFNPRRLLGPPNGKREDGGRGSAAGEWGRKMLFLLGRYPYAVLHRLAGYPERQAGWCLPLLRTLMRLVRRDRVDVVLSSSPPHSTHIALWCLRKMRRFKWVVDFRDPWTAPPYHGRKSPLGGVTRRIEGLVLRACDRIVANTPGNKARLLEAFPFLKPGKVAVVTNGFDTEEEGEPCDVAPGEVDCDLLYAGEIYEGMLDLYIRALLRLRETRGAAAMPRLFIYGIMDRRHADTIRRENLEEHIQFKGRVTIRKSEALMRSARALLLTVTHNDRGGSWVPSKLYAYLFSGRPILAIVPKGDAADIVESTGRGTAVTSADPAVVAEELTRFLSAVGAGTALTPGREQAIDRFRMDSIVADMETILDEVAGAAS